jgi:hypothetical protein
MAAKKKQSNEAAIKPRNNIEVRKDINEAPDDAVARTVTRPEVQAAVTIQQWQCNVSEVNALVKTLSLQVDDVTNGSMKRPEVMLLMQAHTLDELFNNLARKAHRQEYMPNHDAFMRMALKAQNQCRMTLETLSNIKNPPVIFAKQANISNNQQINNSVPAPSQAEENKNRQNKILEHTHGERLDTRTKGEAIPVNSHLETLGKEHGAKIGSG